MSKKKTTGVSELRYEVDRLKRVGGFPVNWTDGGELCKFLASLHPMLMFADGVVVHNLFGRMFRKTRGKDEWHEMKKYVLTGEEAKVLVESVEFQAEKAKIYKEDYGDLRKKNAAMAMILIHYKILDGDNEMGKVALNMENLWMSSSKQVKETKSTNVSEIAKATMKLIKNDEMKKKIKALGENH